MRKEKDRKKINKAGANPKPLGMSKEKDMEKKKTSTTETEDDNKTPEKIMNTKSRTLTKTGWRTTGGTQEKTSKENTYQPKLLNGENLLSTTTPPKHMPGMRDKYWLMEETKNIPKDTSSRD